MIEEKWEENKEECQRITQEFIYDEKRKSECVKYLIDHFKISQATAYRWYDKVYDSISVPTIIEGNKLLEFKNDIEEQVENAVKQAKKLTADEKLNVLTKAIKLKKLLQKLWEFLKRIMTNQTYKIYPRSKVEKLITDFIEEHKIYAQYGKDSEGLFIVQFLVEEEIDDI